MTLVGFLVGLTAHAMIAVLARAFYARQDTVTPVVAAVAAVAINTTLAVILVGPLGLPGIALAIAIAAWVEALALLVILYRRLPHFELRVSGGSAVEVGRRQRDRGAVAFFVVSAWSAARSVRSPGGCSWSWRSRCVGLAFGLVYAAAIARLADP